MLLSARIRQPVGKPREHPPYCWFREKPLFSVGLLRTAIRQSVARATREVVRAGGQMQIGNAPTTSRAAKPPAPTAEIRARGSEMDRRRFKNLAAPTITEHDRRTIGADAAVEIIMQGNRTVAHWLEKQRAICNWAKMTVKTRNSDGDRILHGFFSRRPTPSSASNSAHCIFRNKKSAVFAKIHLPPGLIRRPTRRGCRKYILIAVRGGTTVARLV